mgnify:CR=1 FL=1
MISDRKIYAQEGCRPEGLHPFLYTRPDGGKTGATVKDDVFPFLPGKGLGLRFLCKAVRP